ncbi:MAG: AAA family ATPase [Blastochloris sp.]|nr:AAA family ATPase [Blastochloris sp.]
MKLITAQITHFQSIQDSTEFTIGDVTCLVGKNESGKTALLKALYRLNPIIETDNTFDVTDDYPRRSVADYEDEVSAGSSPARVVKATYLLEPNDRSAVETHFGPDCLEHEDATVTISKGYANETTFTGPSVNIGATLKHLVETAGLSDALTAELLTHTTAPAMLDSLANVEQTDASQRLIAILQPIAAHDLSYVVYNHILRDRIPKFLYFDEYYQMRGQDNINALQQRRATNTLEDSDHPLLGLLELAGLDLNKLVDPKRTEALLSKLEAAENRLTEKVLTYWSQNRHLRLKFDIRPAQPGDPQGMTTGNNIWGRVHDTKHMVSTALGTRSRGFVWFFSFLAWYSQLRRKGERLILLLDEPGLSLHAKAQADLLHYFEAELKPYHQVIYSTHSPFMVDPTHFDRVRIVQDLSIESGSDTLPDTQQGTQVITEVLDATPDSLFPLQGALGYEIYQTLFIGPHSLVVEGISDLLYLQTISALLQAKGETGLHPDWTITPVGGADKVATFVAMIGAQKHLNVAVLVDYQKKDQQNIENLYKRKLLEKKQVLTYADFVAGNEADIEDMFNPGFYLRLVNGEFNSAIAVGHLAQGPPRLLVRLQQYLATHPLPHGAHFNHYRPARYLAEHIGSLESDLTNPQLDRFRQVFAALNALL